MSIHPDAVTDYYGGGSTLAALNYRSWFDCYGTALAGDGVGQTCPEGVSPINANYTYEYVGIGSGAGQDNFLTQADNYGTVSTPPWPCPGAVTTCLPYPRWDFSGSDALLSAGQESCYASGGVCDSTVTLASGVQPVRGQYVQVPTLMTDITMMYNPTGFTVPAGGLRLSRLSYCGIWEGAILAWNDAGITTDNGGTVVSTDDITRVVRQDKSGTSFLLVNNLDTVCQSLSNPAYDWTGGAASTLPSWPNGAGTSPIDNSGSGSSGVVSQVNSTAGSIGYVGPSYDAPIVAGGLPTIDLQNQYAITHSVTQFEAPTSATTTAALKGVTPPANPDPYDLGVLLPNPTNSGSYPIVGFTWLLIYQCYSTAAEHTAITDVVNWYASSTDEPTNADQILESQGLAPLTNKFKGAVHAIMPNVKKGPISGTCTI
ncbi:MAG TPA: substrate-binding domain-containing protein [Candidatus Eremiobacteraceae bacterium]|nr:substrate-binding domain-containing protein [Candidatus Eremiobacteraceae bacterium]